MTVRGLNVLIYHQLDDRWGRGAYLDETTINNVFYPIYRYTRFGDICCEDDFTSIPRRWIENQSLLFWR